MKSLQQYLLDNWDRKIVDHTLRAGLRENGQFHAYIHPDSQDGDTFDFIVEGNDITPLDNELKPTEEATDKRGGGGSETLSDFSVTGCARCGENHEMLTAHPFTRPPDKTITHWAICPKTDEPILIGYGFPRGNKNTFSTNTVGSTPHDPDVVAIVTRLCREVMFAAETKNISGGEEITYEDRGGEKVPVRYSVTFSWAIEDTKPSRNMIFLDVEKGKLTPDQVEKFREEWLKQAKNISQPVPLVYATQQVQIVYTNHRGKTRDRLIQPVGLVWSNGNEWHPEPQWLLDAVDLEKGEIRSFAMKDVYNWGSIQEGEEMASTPPISEDDIELVAHLDKEE